MSAQPSKKNTIVFLCSVVFLDALGFGIILPILPDIIKSLSDLSYSQAAVIAGYMLFTFAAMQFFFAPVMGGLSDRFGRRPVLLLALSGFAADYFLMALAPSLIWLLVARAVSGIFGATYAAANAAIVDLSSPDERAKYFGITSAAIGLGFVIGPAFGGLLGEFNTRLPFFVAGFLTICAVGFGYWFMPETLKPENRRKFEWGRANPLGSLYALRNASSVLIFLPVLFLVQLAMHSYTSIWSFFTIEIAGWSTFYIGLSIAFYGVMMVVVQGGLTQPIVKLLGERRAVVTALIVGIVTYAGLANVSAGWQIYLMVFIGGFSAFGIPALQALMTKSVADDSQGELQGAIACSHSIAAIVGPLIMTRVFAHHTTASEGLGPGAAFLVSTALIFAALIVFLLFGPKLAKTNPYEAMPQNGVLDDAVMSEGPMAK